MISSKLKLLQTHHAVDFSLLSSKILFLESFLFMRKIVGTHLWQNNVDLGFPMEAFVGKVRFWTRCNRHLEYKIIFQNTHIFGLIDFIFGFGKYNYHCYSLGIRMLWNHHITECLKIEEKNYCQFYDSSLSMYFDIIILL